MTTPPAPPPTAQTEEPLWRPPSPHTTQLHHFIQRLNRTHHLTLHSYTDLYTYSTADGTRLAFWRALWEDEEVNTLVYEGGYTEVLDPPTRMFPPPTWFAGVRLNFAENILFGSPRDPTAHKPGDRIAITALREDDTDPSSGVELSWSTLRARVGQVAHALRRQGVRRGDRVAVVAGHGVAALLVWLGCATVGAVFCSGGGTEMGARGLGERLRLVRPRWVFVEDRAVWGGRGWGLEGRWREVVGLLGEGVGWVVVPRDGFGDGAEVVEGGGWDGAVGWREFMRGSEGVGEEGLVFERVGFGDPFLICFSSGTTGLPKCIVHSVGGVLLNAVKEGRLQRDLGSGAEEVGLQYTTTGWIMYLSSVLGLLFGGRAVLYDGSPFHPDITSLLRIASAQRVTHLGISPRYLHELVTHGVRPRDVVDLSQLRSVTSTGMVLSEPLFRWFYATGFPPHVHLGNMSGGTDIAGCFGMENPLTPVYAGGCQGPSLGIRVEVYDEEGRPVPPGTAGELVATRPFPNQPVFFWGDEPDQRTYFHAYFARFAAGAGAVWAHGDFVEFHPRTGGLLFHGRADGVLNPSGVRFGSAEIYGVLERHFAGEVRDGICVGQRRPGDADERVMLFLLMVPRRRFTPALAHRVREVIGRELSRRHVPRFVFETPAIPTTVNFKKVELPVKQIVSGKRVKPSGTLLNPESLEYYYRFARVEDVLREQEEKEKLEQQQLRSSKL